MKALRMIGFLLCLMSIDQASAQNFDEKSRASFVATQDAYLQSLELSFYQNKQYQVITRNADKEERTIVLSNMPARLKKKKVKKVQKEKNKLMKELLNKRQYQRYLKRQKVIKKTLSNQASF